MKKGVRNENKSMLSGGLVRANAGRVQLEVPRAGAGVRHAGIKKR